MKTAAIAFAVVGLATATATASVAASRATDTAYLAASRCKGLAAGLGSVDTTNLDTFLKVESRNRNENIYQQGIEVQGKAKREAGFADAKPRLTAELNGRCMTFMVGDKTVGAH